MTDEQILEHVDDAIAADSLKTRRWIEQYVGDKIGTMSDKLTQQTRLLIVSAVIANQTLAKVETGLEVAGVTAAFATVLHLNRISALVRGLFDR